MKRAFLSSCAGALLLLLVFAVEGRAQQTPAARVAEIQAALRAAQLDGWLFYDFRRSDPLAYRILRLDERGITTRRWFYYVPATGEPVKIVHSIEREKLDQLPGRRVIYRRWQELQASLREALIGIREANMRSGPVRVLRIAMQYSPENAIPYISRVDAGTVELVRSIRGNQTVVSPVSSGDLVQQFEAALTPAQRETHIEAANKINQIIMDSFAEIARRIRADEATTEYDIQQFMERRFAAENLTNENDPPIVAVNANSANPHYQPSRERHSPIRRGDFVLFDVWGKLRQPGAIYADQTWVGYVGETVPEEHARIFRLVREARDAAVAFIRGGLRAGRPITGADVDDVARGVVTRAGYGEQFTHRTGHSIGEEVHGNGAHMDNLETRDTRRVVPRTAFSVEPGIYLEGRFGVRSEINIYVGERDIEVTGPRMQTEVVAILR